MRKTCPICKAAFECRTEGGCWCAELPPFLPVPAPGEGGCLCPACLNEKLQAALRKKVVAPIQN